MNICAILAKYNPYSNCHLYHAAKTREHCGCDAVLAVMAGSVLNSGEPCAAGREKRANWAVNAGIDCVIELPAVYCLTDFQSYVAGLAKTLSPLKNFTLSFGSGFSETEDILSFKERRQSENKEHVKLFSDFLKNENAAAGNGASSVKQPKAAAGNSSAILPLENEQKFCGEKDSQESMFLHFLKEAKKLKLNVSYRTQKKVEGARNFLPSEIILEKFYCGEDISKLVPPEVRFSGIDIKKFQSLCLYAVNSKSADELSGILNFCGALIQKTTKSKPSSFASLLELAGGGVSRAQIKRAAICAAIGVEMRHLELALSSPPYMRVLAVKNGREDVINYLKTLTPNVFFNASEIPPKIRPLAQLDDKADKLLSLVTR